MVLADLHPTPDLMTQVEARGHRFYQDGRELPGISGSRAGNGENPPGADGPQQLWPGPCCVMGTGPSHLETGSLEGLLDGAAQGRAALPSLWASRSFKAVTIVPSVLVPPQCRVGLKEEERSGDSACELSHAHGCPRPHPVPQEASGR